MSDTQVRDDVPVGRYLAVVREEAGLTQAPLAAKVTLSPASVSRIESGDKSLSTEEFDAMLRAIGTANARQLRAFDKHNCDVLPRPDLDLPNRQALWSANGPLRNLRKLRENPSLKNVFVRQIDHY